MRAFEIALNRPPTADEVEVALAYLARQEGAAVSTDAPPADKREDQAALASFCKLVLNLNEFVYVD
jgi:hypothetical protein